MKFLLSNNGNGDAYAALGDLASGFYLWDGQRKYPNGKGVPKNWVWVKEDHPKVQANLEALKAGPPLEMPQRVEPAVDRPWQPQVFQQGDSPDDEIE